MSFLKLVTPVNIAEERSKFFKDKTYSPQFIYDWSEVKTKSLSEIDKELREVLRLQDGKKLSEFGESYFAIKQSSDDMAFAKQTINTVPAKKIVTAEQYAKCALEKFKQLGIDYRIEIVDKHGFQGRPDHKHRVLRLSKYMSPEYYSAKGLVRHEIVHIIRAINGEFNGIKPQDSYLGTEEGLAAFIQDDLLKTNTSSLFQHSVEYLAAYVAKDKGFLEVYDFMIKHGSSPESAWLRSIRQKFGLCDTSKHGSLMKSAMQYYYEMQISRLTTDEVMKLFVGKIRLDQLKEYNEYSGKFDKENILGYLF